MRSLFGGTLWAQTFCAPVALFRDADGWGCGAAYRRCQRGFLLICCRRAPILQPVSSCPTIFPRWVHARKFSGSGRTRELPWRTNSSKTTTGIFEIGKTSRICFFVDRDRGLR